MNPFYEQFNTLITSHRPFVKVTLVDAVGSIPQEVGAKLLATSDGLYFGTVGGGKVEKRVLDEATRLLSEEQTNHFVEWSLNQDIGMTCGGSVKFFFEVFNTGTWKIVVFGAGHVANALIHLLSKLDCQITCIDPRTEWLEKLPQAPHIHAVCAENMPHAVANIPDHAFVLLITMGHTTDAPILLEILRSRKFPYLGAIGSKAKAIQFEKDIAAAGLSLNDQPFFCPVGLDIGSNHPQEIAVSIVAQLLQERDRFTQSNT